VDRARQAGPWVLTWKRVIRIRHVQKDQMAHGRQLRVGRRARGGGGGAARAPPVSAAPPAGHALATMKQNGGAREAAAPRARGWGAPSARQSTSGTFPWYVFVGGCGCGGAPCGERSRRGGLGMSTAKEYVAHNRGAVAGWARSMGKCRCRRLCAAHGAAACLSGGRRGGAAPRPARRQVWVGLVRLLPRPLTGVACAAGKKGWRGRTAGRAAAGAGACISWVGVTAGGGWG
jgi:hypothetical protein